MACKPETEAQRLERIATQLLAGMLSNSSVTWCRAGSRLNAETAILHSKELIKQLDALAIAE